jgi:hypothetical protein
MSQTIEETDSLTNFAADPKRYLDRLRQMGGPMLLTVDGEPGLVIQDATAYERFLDVVDRLETIAAVKEGLRDVAAGRTWPAQDALDELARKYDLPPVSDE